MTLLRSIILIFALLAQSWPAQAMTCVNEAAACGMGCCSALAVAEMGACDCAEPPAPSETGTPPAGGRDRVLPVVWMTFEDALTVAWSATGRELAQARGLDRDRPNLPHVRLPVLFCSWLN